MIARFRRLYGASPLHLLAVAATALVAGAAVAGWFDNTTSITIRILVWFLALIVAHDLILVPLYSLVDRIGLRVAPGLRSSQARDRAPGWVYVRVPAGLSGLLFLVFFPEILKLGDQTFSTASGLHQNVYLARYLLACGALFAISGVAYAVSLVRARSASLSHERVDHGGVTVPERGGGGPEADVGGEHHGGGHEREDQIGPQHEDDGPQPPRAGQSGEGQDPQHVAGGGPAERDDEHQQRQRRDARPSRAADGRPR